MTKTSASIESICIEGLSAYRIKNSKLSLDVVPELGGKIVSLRSGSGAQTEWLWKNGRIGYQPAALDDSYTRNHDSGGIDECFPSVDTCTLPGNSEDFSGLTLPDHGELYGRPWELLTCETDIAGRAILVMRRTCGTLPCEFQRTLILSPNEGVIEFKYEVLNESDSAVPFSWCMHPALAIAPGMTLRLPENHQLHCSYASNNAPLATGDTFRWPLTPDGTDMSVIPDPGTQPNSSSRFAAKLLSLQDLFDCTSGNTPAIAGLENPATGEALHFALPPAEVPHIALWLNYGGWAGDGGAPYFNLVLEPAIGNGDSLRELIDRNAAPVVLPRSKRRWAFEVRLGSM